MATTFGVGGGGCAPQTPCCQKFYTLVSPLTSTTSATAPTTIFYHVRTSFESVCLHVLLVCVCVRVVCVSEVYAGI